MSILLHNWPRLSNGVHLIIKQHLFFLHIVPRFPRTIGSSYQYGIHLLCGQLQCATTEPAVRNVKRVLEKRRLARNPHEADNLAFLPLQRLPAPFEGIHCSELASMCSCVAVHTLEPLLLCSIRACNWSMWCNGVRDRSLELHFDVLDTSVLRIKSLNGLFSRNY